jgi:hypothetical protein
MINLVRELKVLEKSPKLLTLTYNEHLAHQIKIDLWSMNKMLNKKQESNRISKRT